MNTRPALNPATRQASATGRSACSAALMVLLLGASVSAGTAAEPVPARSVRDFLDSIGVCTHIGQGIDDPSRTAAALAYVGIRNLRDDGSSRHVQDWIAVHAQTGVRVVLTASGPDDRTRTSLLRMSRELAAAGALLALEGPNEPNNWAVTYHGQQSRADATFLPVAQWQQALYAAAKNDPVLKHYPVFHSSEAGGAEPDNVGLQFLAIPPDAATLMPSGTRYADFANVHNYICRKPQIIDNMAWLNADPVFRGWSDGLYVEYGKTWRKGFAGYSDADLRRLPRVTTETGWVTGGKGLTEEQQGRLYLNLYLAQFKQRFKYTFIYMLRDAGGSDSG
ncbi:MAG: glycosyl hydrolase, partial [Verrucomicrobia bacterium]|nr:glycosyl hydrolase [Verrucomicrobiota bacterium]